MGRAIKHGGWKHPEYKVWTTMKARCHNKAHHKYYMYGARGISVCEQWRNDYGKFISDMGRRPAKGYSIDRRDGNGNYEPSNCVWATPLQQASHTRRQRIVEYEGQSLSVSELARQRGMTIDSLHSRLARGWSLEEAVTIPVTPYKKKRAITNVAPSTARRITHNGSTLTIAQWAKELGMKPRSLRYRLLHGWTEHDALTIPIGQTKKPGTEAPG